MLNKESITPVFCLSGCGYLHDLVETDDKTIASIKMLTQYDENPDLQDDIWLECEVKDRKQLFRLRALASKLKKGCEVILTFEAQYTSLSSVYTGQTQQDPTAMVMFQGKLLRLEDCYVNGQRASEYLRLAAAA